jgi:hypothetical protein
MNSGRRRFARSILAVLLEFALLCPALISQQAHAAAPSKNPQTFATGPMR